MNNTAAQPAHPANDLARRLDILLSALALLVAARFRVLGVLSNPLWTRVTRANARLTRLLGQLAAGCLPRRRQRLPRPQSRDVTAPMPPRLPRGRAWIVRMLGYEAVGHAAQLESLLRNPATVALLAAAPTAARTLRPLCRMLGVELPPELQLPPRPPRPRPNRDKPARPAAPPHPPMRPIYPSRHPRELLIPLVPAKSIA